MGGRAIVSPLPLETAAQSEHRTAHGLLRQARQVAIALAARAAQTDSEGAVPLEEVRLLREAGLLTVALGCTLGGAGWGIDPGHTAPLLELLAIVGHGNLAVGRIYEGHINALQLIQWFGTAEQVREQAAAVRSGLLFGLWNSEAQDGLQLVPLSDGRYQLMGSKTFASGCGCVARPIVGAALPGGGWQLVIVPLDRVAAQVDPGWWQPLGMRGSASFKVDFSGITLGREALLGAPGDYYRQPWLTAGVVRFAAVQAGGAGALFDATRTELRERGWTEDPYQRERLGQMAIAVQANRLWLAAAAQTFDQLLTGQGDTLVAQANMARTAIEAHCQQIIQLAARSLGARSLLRPHPVERLVRDLTIYLRQPAPDAALAGVGTFVLASDAAYDQIWSDGD